MEAMMGAIESQKLQLDALTSGTSSTTPTTLVETSDKDKPSLNEDDPDKIDNLGFIIEGKLAAIFIKPSLGVSNWPVIYFVNYTPTISLTLFNTTPSGSQGPAIS
jgi:hypothetical protein